MLREKSMNKGFSWVFLALSAVFFIFIVGLTGYRIEDTRKSNAESARERLPGLTAKARSIRDSTGGFDAPQFKKDMREVFEEEPRLLLLSLHSPEDGILYLVARNRTYMKEPSPVTPAWRGVPVYQVSKGYELLLSREMGDERTPLTLDAMFVIMGREDLYPIVRDDLYLFLAFLLVCGVVILIVTSIQEAPTETYARAATSGAPAAASPVPAPLQEQSFAPARHEPYRPEPLRPEPPRPEPRRPEAAQPEPLQPAARPDMARDLTSPRTGLVWSDHLESRLHAELERAASSDQDVALARVLIDQPYADAGLPKVHAAVARLIRDSFPLQDLIFEAGDDSYTLILPDNEVDAAVRVLDEFRKKVAKTTIEERNRTVSIGVSSRGGRLIEDSTLLEEAVVSAAKAVREGGNQVIGFRADPARYRDALSGVRT
jgi:GGDEF domain-containing protein